MDSIPWLIIGIGVLIILFAVFAWKSRQIKKRPTDYYTFFIIGLTWVPIGLATENNTFWIMGLIFMATGLAHKSEWEKNKVRWNDLTEEEKRLKKTLITALLVLLLIGIALIL